MGAVMSELRFSREDVTELVNELASLKPPLSGPSQRLLLTIFSAASDRVTSRESEITITDLREQLLNAFIRDDGNDFVIAAPKVGKVGPG